MPRVLVLWLVSKWVLGQVWLAKAWEPWPILPVRGLGLSLDLRVKGLVRKLSLAAKGLVQQGSWVLLA